MYNGDTTRSRTGLQGFAGLCITDLPWRLMLVHYRDREMESKSKSKKFMRDNRDHSLSHKSEIILEKQIFLFTTKCLCESNIGIGRFIERNREMY